MPYQNKFQCVYILCSLIATNVRTASVRCSTANISLSLRCRTKHFGSLKSFSPNTRDDYTRIALTVTNIKKVLLMLDSSIYLWYDVPHYLVSEQMSAAIKVKLYGLCNVYDKQIDYCNNHSKTIVW